MSDLKNQLVRLGSTNPELREHIRPVLSELEKEASSNLLWSILDKSDFASLRREMKRAGDEQSADLLFQIYRHLESVLSVPKACHQQVA